MITAVARGKWCPHVSILHIGTSNPANLFQWCWNLRPTNIQSLRKFLVRCPCHPLPYADTSNSRRAWATEQHRIPRMLEPHLPRPRPMQTMSVTLKDVDLRKKKHQHSKISFQDCQPWWSGFAFLTCLWHDDKSSYCNRGRSLIWGCWSMNSLVCQGGNFSYHL